MAAQAQYLTPYAVVRGKAFYQAVRHDVAPHEAARYFGKYWRELDLSEDDMLQAVSHFAADQ